MQLKKNTLYHIKCYDTYLHVVYLSYELVTVNVYETLDDFLCDVLLCNHKRHYTVKKQALLDFNPQLVNVDEMLDERN